MNTVKSLLLGDFSALLYAAPKSKEYSKLSQSIKTAEKDLFAKLSKKQKAQYEECVGLLLQREAVSLEEKFTDAFILGARMMCDILKEGK